MNRRHWSTRQEHQRRDGLFQWRSHDRHLQEEGRGLIPPDPGQSRSVGTLSGTTIEIGPGPGGLTRALLLEGADHVIAIEKDRRAANVLAGLTSAAGSRLSLIEADAMTSAIWEMGDAPRRIIANLPYNIATTLLISWLGHASAFASMTLMFQR